MKKVFFLGIAAAAMLASCSNDETIDISQAGAIGFSNAFVNNGTRSTVDPSFTTTSLTSFDVYGFTQKGQIFDEVTVSKSGSAWTYSPTQYWVEGNTYTFGAIAPSGTTVNNEAVSGGKVTMTIPFTSDGKKDLIHAAPTAINADETFMGLEDKTVKLTFNHQLAKVKFSFVNGVGEGYNIKITDVKITNAKKTGTLTVGASNAWSAQEENGSLELDFGVVGAAATTADAIANGAEGETYNEMLTIPTPSTASYTVTFKAELLQGTVSLTTYSHETTISGVELKLGYCYDFKATLTSKNINPGDPDDPDNPELQPIEFSVDKIEPWNTTEQDKELGDYPEPTPGA